MLIMEQIFDTKYVSSVGKKIYHKRAKNGYIYTLSKTGGSGTEYWKCSLRDKCAATLVQKGPNVEHGRKGWDPTTNEHLTHAPDYEKCEAEIAIGTAKKIAIDDPFCKTAEIWDKATQNVSLHAQTMLPTEKLFKDTIRNYKKSQYHFKDSRMLMDLSIPRTYQFTLRGDKFLHFDSLDNKRILLFTTLTNLHMLAECETWIADGTFKSCPKLYRKHGQVYTIHGVFVRKNTKGQVETTALPLVYALLRDKSKITYRTLFTELVQIGRKEDIQFNPEYIIVDFEAAAITELDSAFPNAKVQGCLFHLAQSIQRRIQQEGLQARQQTDKSFASQCKYFHALAFVPVIRVPKVYVRT